ncbi:MAG: hypothetical protein ACOYIK_04915 [Coriobacteriales bacterium]
MTRDNKDNRKATVFSEDEKWTVGPAIATGFFTGSGIVVVVLLVCIVGSLIFAGPIEGILLTLSLVIAGIAGGILQQLFFNYMPAYRMSYPMRLFLFSVSYFVVLLGCAFLGNWFPKDIVGAWILFVVIFLAILLIASLAIGHSLKKKGIEYKAKLDDYHEARKSE